MLNDALIREKINCQIQVTQWPQEIGTENDRGCHQTTVTVWTWRLEPALTLPLFKSFQQGTLNTEWHVTITKSVVLKIKLLLPWSPYKIIPLNRLNENNQNINQKIVNRGRKHLSHPYYVVPGDILSVLNVCKKYRRQASSSFYRWENESWKGQETHVVSK